MMVVDDVAAAAGHGASSSGSAGGSLARPTTNVANRPHRALETNALAQTKLFIYIYIDI